MIGGGRWKRVRGGISMELRECPECFALVHGPDGQEGHRRAHDEADAEPEDDIYEYADGVKVGRPPGAWRQVRDIFRIRPPRDPAGPERQAEPSPAPESAPETAPEPPDRRREWAAMRGLIQRTTTRLGA